MRRSRCPAFGFPWPASAALATLAVLAAAFVPARPAAAQQRPLEHDDVLRWNTIASPSLSPDGEWLAFVLTAMEGDPALTIRPAQEGSSEAVVRGVNPVFSSDSRYLVYDVPPLEAVVDSLKREGKKGDDLPNDSLAVVELAALFQGGEFRLEAIRVVGPVNGRKIAPKESGRRTNLCRTKGAPKRPRAGRRSGPRAKPRRPRSRAERRTKETKATTTRRTARRWFSTT